MPWGRLDDSLYDHPKLDLLPADSRLAAIGLWARAISWSNRFLTDGHVPRARIEKLDGTTELAAHLVAAGLFDAAANGYDVHDFLQFNDSRESIEKRRQTEKDRKAAWRAGRRPNGTTNGTASTDDADVPPSVPVGVPPVSQRPSRRLSRQVSRDSPRARDRANPDPTRPDPSESSTTPPTPSPARGRTRRSKASTGADPSQYDRATISDDEPEGDVAWLAKR